MNTGLDQYMDIFKDAVEDSAAKLTKSFEKILIEVIILFMVIPRKINFTQMGRYVSLAKRFFGKQGRWAIAIDPSYISKAGKKKLFFSTDTSLSFFIIESGSRSNFAFKASFTSLNVAKVTMKEMGMEYSMSSFKSLMINIYLMRRIFKACGYNPNRTLISFQRSLVLTAYSCLAHY